ncbi:RNA 3'-terminal phosphate cyclase-like protein [Ceratobasidium theobromae]|uniref:RNA 3'-terminal phosphate cyclase-like protein n=1 Tax=Ceratobasidium theobromae TaxID=1582974 RepID=A0A5N5QP94_9AGAM|nr:RNA 3'-terminal phosphate cyclase-like protein [Ceratobasidium theobromae]
MEQSSKSHTPVRRYCLDPSDSLGTSFLLTPGVISGGTVTHDCPLSRSVGYFLEPLIALAPFCKKQLRLTLRGITADDRDLSVDLVRTVTLPHLALFGLDTGLELKVRSPPAQNISHTRRSQNAAQRRSAAAKSTFHVPPPNSSHPSTSPTPEKYSASAALLRVGADKCPRMIDSARTILNRYIPDIYLVPDIYRTQDSGKSPGFGITLVATSTTGVLHSAEAIAQPGSLADEIGKTAARLLLSEIRHGGCVDRNHQWLVLLFMALGPQDVARCRMGPLTPKSVQLLRDMKEFFGTSFKIAPADESEDLILSCLGTGYINTNKTAA